MEEKKEERIEEYKKELVWSSSADYPRMGQSVGCSPTDVKLTCNSTDISISVAYHKSQLKNKMLALQLYELALMEITNPKEN